MLKDMGFFDEMPPPPPAEEPEEYRPPEWMAAPENVVGRFADVGAVLVRGPDVAVTTDGFIAYPTGVEFHMTVRTRQPDYELDPFFRVCRPRSRHGDAPSDVLRLGFQFSDGSKATYGGSRSFRSSDDGTPDGPVLSLGGGGGGGRTWRATMWLWPLPPEGPLALVVEWPSREVPETRVALSADPLRAAAAKATVLWPDDRPEPPPDGPACFAR